MSTGSRNSKHGPQTARDDPGRGLLDALVAGERASMEPTADGEQQTWERVVASVAVGGPPAVPPASIPGPTASVTSLWVKIVLGVIVGGVVASAGYALSPDPEPVTASVTESREQPPAPPPRPTPVPAREHPPVLAEPAAVLPSPSPAAIAPEASSQKQARAAPTKPDAPPTSDLTEETRLLARARAHLRAGSPADSLPPLAEHARRFPQGQLTEDRLVLQAQALCESGDTQAGLKKAAALHKAFPDSSHLPRVNRACE